MGLTGKQTADGRVVWIVEADTDNLKKDMESATKIVEGETKKWDKASKEATSGMGEDMDGLNTKIKQLGAEFGKFIVQYTAESIKLASSVKELDDTIGAVFGEGGSGKINQWSKGLVSSFGLSELQAKKIASGIGLIAKQAGLGEDAVYELGKGVTELSADFGSFTGNSTESVASAIQSALTGTGTTLKKMGIDASATKMKEYAESQGYDNFSSLTSDLQMLLRYQYIKEQIESLAKGNYEKNRSNPKNVQERLTATQENDKINKGNEFVPIVEWGSGVLSDLLDWYNNIDNSDWYARGKASEGMIPDKAVLEEGKTAIEDALKAYRDEMSAQMEETVKDLGLTREMFEEEGGAEQFGSFFEWAFNKIMEEPPEGLDINGVYDILDQYGSSIEMIEKANQQLSALQEQIAFVDAQKVSEGQKVATDEQNLALTIETGTQQVGNALTGLSSAINNSLSPYGKIPQYATGIDYVPNDRHLAFLDRGESVLTAEEAKVWRAMKYSGGVSRTPDYAAWGATMRDNVKAGGNVYLDGQSVGRVISARQADSYRAMERSGFQQ